MTSIAGHTFADGPAGRACSVCGKTWLAVLADREFWKDGQGGIAHSGALNAAEVGELHAELDRTWASVKAAVEA